MNEAINAGGKGRPTNERFEQPISPKEANNSLVLLNFSTTLLRIRNKFMIEITEPDITFNLKEIYQEKENRPKDKIQENYS